MVLFGGLRTQSTSVVLQRVQNRKKMCIKHFIIKLKKGEIRTKGVNDIKNKKKKYKDAFC